MIPKDNARTEKDRKKVCDLPDWPGLCIDVSRVRSTQGWHTTRHLFVPGWRPTRKSDIIFLYRDKRGKYNRPYMLAGCYGKKMWLHLEKKRD